jgi:hypothetical protein
MLETLQLSAPGTVTEKPIKAKARADEALESAAIRATFWTVMDYGCSMGPGSDRTTERRNGISRRLSRQRIMDKSHDYRLPEIITAACDNLSALFFPVCTKAGAPSSWKQ